jgi:predicted DNA-binding protein
MTWGTKKNVSHAMRTVQIKRLKEHSHRTGLSISRIMRDAVDSYLDAHMDVSNIDAAINSVSNALCRLEEMRNGRDEKHSEVEHLSEGVCGGSYR